MKKISIIIIACVIIIASGFTISMLWNVADQGVIINFELPAQGTNGTISGLKASIDFNQKDLAASKISASVDVKTLNTGDPKKDEHLMAADFFNAEKYPTMLFVSSSIKANADGFMATGNLTIKDSTKAVEIPFSFIEDATGAGTFKGTLSIFSGDYGVTKKNTTGKDKVVVMITVPVKK